MNTTGTARTSRPALRLAVAAVWTALLFAMLGAAVQAITILTGRALMTFGGADGRLPLETLPQLLQADLHEGESAFLTDVPVWLRLLCAGPGIIQALTILAAAVLVTRILRGISAGDSFAPGVRRALRWLAATLCGGALLKAGADFAAVSTLWRLGDLSSPTRLEGFLSPYQGLGFAPPSVPWMLLLLGIIAAALAVAFREGARLKEDTIGIV